MTAKRLTLLIALILGWGVSQTAFAQQSAQATMKVQVTVVKGSAITVEKEPRITLQRKMDREEVAKISTFRINSADQSVIAFSRPDNIQLQSEEGSSLTLPVFYSDIQSGKQIISQVNAGKISNIQQLPARMYKGALTTSVAYL
ncbi:MAG: hypothetical protein R3222_08055 [Balneolaceae bacterium]|nr:hypothetical protein [Balneolaceae bacterium]